MKRITLIALAFILVFQTISSADLFQYIAKEDPNFEWKLLEEKALPFEIQKYDIEFVSQKWQDIVWNHHLTLVMPKSVKDPTMVFMIIVGSWNKKDEDEMMYASAIASGIGAPVAVLYDVPRQPLFNKLKEDALISYTFMKVLETKDPEWALLLPMTKTACKAMDVIEQFADEKLGIMVNGFVVAGGSKRGWTTWLTSAVDKRVMGICPMVYDNLNLPAQMKHQIDTWGKYSEQIDDYSSKGLPQILESEEGKELSKLVDPYTYIENIDIPKLIVVGTNDRYWTLDAMNLYFNDLIGEKYILRVPNKGHDVGDFTRVINDAIAFFLKVNGDLIFPMLDWDYGETEEGLELFISSDITPKSVSVWTSSSATKDFRDVKWEETKLEPQDGEYSYTLKKPQNGYSAVFGEVVYTYADKEYYLSTEIRIIGKE
ncbi:TPA: phenylacetic acid degradation protein [bacterium]|nr:phenylacetic acid degradation protein [bacterium]